MNIIQKEEWKDLLLGLQKKLSLTQIEILKKLGLNSRSGISCWINGIHIPLQKIQSKIMTYLLRNNFDFKYLIEFGKKARNSLEFNNEFIPLNLAVKRDYFGEDLLLEINNKKYLNVPLVFPKVKYTQPLEFILKGKDVIIFYKYKFAHSLFPLKFPKLLDLSKEFLVGLGIYLGEGARNRHPKITNSTPLVIKQAIKFFQLFNFNNDDFSAWIQLHERSKKTFKQVETFWLENTSLLKHNIKEIRIKKSTGSAEVEQFGTLHLEIQYILFEIFINNLLLSIPQIINSLSKNELMWFLQGVYAGEGYVGIAKSGAVNEVNYTSTRIEERELVKQILDKFGIKYKEDNKAEGIRIFGYENIKKIYELDIFAYHPERKQKLENGLICLTKSHIPFLNKNKILGLFKLNNSLTVAETADLLNLTYSCVKKHVSELYRNQKINKVPGSGTIPDRWFII